MKYWNFHGSLNGTMYYPGADDFIHCNYRKRLSGETYDDITLIFEPENEYDPNAIKVVVTETQLEIGHVDRNTAAQIALLSPSEISGRFEEVFQDYATLFISVTSSFSDEDTYDIINSPDSFIERNYPQYANMAFGSDCPTFRQFSYALNLGINPNKKTFKNISHAIERANSSEKQRKPCTIPDESRRILYDFLVNNSPASRDEISTIHSFHGETTRYPLKKIEAWQIIELLENTDLLIECPYCKKKVPNEEYCDYCLRSFRNLRIPIFWNEKGPYLGKFYFKHNDSYSHKTKKHYQSSEMEITPGDICLGCAYFLVFAILVVVFLLFIGMISNH